VGELGGGGRYIEKDERANSKIHLGGESHVVLRSSECRPETAPFGRRISPTGSGRYRLAERYRLLRSGTLAARFSLWKLSGGELWFLFSQSAAHPKNPPCNSNGKDP
jgi:hypothetical protein